MIFYISFLLKTEGRWNDSHTAYRMNEKIGNMLKKMPEKMQIILCIAFICTGICCMAMTDRIHQILPVILGIVLIMAGIVSLLLSFTVKTANKDRFRSEALLFLILGMIMFVRQEGSDYRIGVILGMISLIRNSRSLMKNAGSKKVLPALISMAGLVISTVLLADPLSHLHFHIFLLGIELVILGMMYMSKMFH